MERKLTVTASSSRPSGKSWKDVINKSPNFSKNKIGDQYQKTVRFQEETFQRVKYVQQLLDVSLAEAIRRIVKEGLTQIREHHIVFLELLENMQEDAEDVETQKAAQIVEEKVIENQRQL